MKKPLSLEKRSLWFLLFCGILFICDVVAMIFYRINTSNYDFWSVFFGSLGSCALYAFADEIERILERSKSSAPSGADENKKM